MDVLLPIVQVVLRSAILLSPLAIAWLAYRRLLLSKTSNAWIYATMALTATVTAVGLAPWAFGIGPSSWVFFLLAAFCPALWVGIVILCDGRWSENSYEFSKNETDDVPQFKSRHKNSAPLVLINPTWNNESKILFLHHANMKIDDAVSSGMSETSRELLDVAKSMRGNPNSEGRRPKLLMAPTHSASLKDMPFIRTSA